MQVANIILITILFFGYISGQTIMINEFLASSKTCCDNGQGSYEDFVEIYNYGNEGIDIAGFKFTDGYTGSVIPKGFPETMVPAGGFAVLWFDENSDLGPLHIDAKLGSGGETIIIYNTKNIMIRKLSYEKQYRDATYSQIPDGSGTWNFTTTPTPGKPNIFNKMILGCKDPESIIYNPNATHDDGSCGQITDFDGNIYRTVKIGNQFWTTDNLKTTHYSNGEKIPYGNNQFNNDEEYVEIYGKLYNWYSLNNDNGIAPMGWHVPSDEEWQELVEFLGGNRSAGGKMKEDGTVHWKNPNKGATNKSGFTALPSGKTNFANFGSSTDYKSGKAWYIKLSNNSPGVYRGVTDKRLEFSIRCVKD